MIDRAALATLAAVLRSGSFDRASARLGVTPSAVSQRIKSLEEQMGAALILRGTPCAATPLGARLLRHADAVGALEAQLLGEIGVSGAAMPTLRIAVTADSLATWLIPALASVKDVLFDLVIDDQDHSADWLRRGEVAGALTARAQPVQGCDAVQLGALRYHAAASPGYLTRWFPEGLTPEAARTAPMLQFNAKDALQHQWLRGQIGAEIAPLAHQIASAQGFHDAAVAGLGWGMIPAALIKDDLSRGRLALLAPDPLDQPLTWQTPRATKATTTALTAAIRHAARTGLVTV